MAKIPWYLKLTEPRYNPETNCADFTLSISLVGQIVLGAKALWNLLLTIITKKSHGSWEVSKYDRTDN